MALPKLSLLAERVILNLNIGDRILTGKYRNKEVLVKDIAYDKHGELTVNGRKALNFRIVKSYKTIPEPEEDEKKKNDKKN